MGIVKEFKEFALRGNVVDLAVGVVIGGAFGKIVTSLVNDVIMPVVGYVSGGQQFAGRKYVLGGEGEQAAAIVYGNFIQSIVDFLIVAFCIFIMVKLINTARKRMEGEQEAPAAAPPEDIALLREIRDALQRTNPRRAE